MPGYIPPNHYKPKPKPPIDPYHGSTSVPDATGTGTATAHTTFTAPPVPPPDGQHSGTSVDTASMETFAKNIQLLIQPTNDARKLLDAVNIAPGAFYHANKMRIAVNGPNGDDGLKKQFEKVLDDLAKGLTDLHQGVIDLATKYKTIEDANHMASTELQTFMGNSSADFGGLVTDAGGSPAPGGGGGGGGGGGKPGNGNT